MDVLGLLFGLTAICMGVTVALVLLAVIITEWVESDAIEAERVEREARTAAGIQKL